MRPSIALLIPVYQDQAGLLKSLDSLLQAEQPAPMVTIIVDDGSIPPLEVDCRHYEAIHPILLRLPRNAGIEAALNAGIDRALGLGADYVARLDAGDTIRYDRLRLQWESLEARPDVGLVASDALFVTPSGELLFRFSTPPSDAEIRRRMPINSCLPHPTVMLRAEALRRLGAYVGTYPAAEDYELFLRLLGRYRALSIPEPLTTKVVSEDGISSRRRRRQLQSRLRLQWRHFQWSQPASYGGVVTTLALFLVPARLLTAAKRRLGSCRY